MALFDQKSINLNKTSEIICVQHSSLNLTLENSRVRSNAPADAVTMEQCLTTRHSIVYAALWTEKLNLFDRNAAIGSVGCFGVSKVTTHMQRHHDKCRFKYYFRPNLK